MRETNIALAVLAALASTAAGVIFLKVAMPLALRAAGIG